MKKLDLEKEIINGHENEKKIKELYQLLSSYNAYCSLLLKAKQEYEGKKTNIKQNYLNSDCYKKQIADLFKTFKNDEYLIGKLITQTNHEDMLFLIDQDTLFRIYSFDIKNSTIDGLASINYKFIKINNCKAKIYKQNIYYRDPYYCDSHEEYKDALGFFHNNNEVTPGYVLDSQFIDYDNMDIREILKIQSLDDIYEKINESKNIKSKKLILTK